MASPATLPPLAEPADLADVLGEPDTDARVVAAIRRASNRFRGAVRWHVSAVADRVVTLDGNGRGSLRVPARELTACAVSLRTPGGLVELVEGRDFDWSGDGIVDRVGGLWPAQRRAVVVTYSGGFDPVPEDVQEAVIDQAEVMFRVPRGLSSLQVGGVTESFGVRESTGLAEQWVAAVMAYRIGVGDRS